MKILHYALGFPPYRSGGLTKFVVDLMAEQTTQGHDVALLWPGTMKLFGKGISIKKRRPQNGAGSYELINPLPVSYDEGIVDTVRFTAPADGAVYASFLKEIRPDVVHIHTFMGLHREFLEATKQLGIRTVFSVHDFFAACPKVTLFLGGEICAGAADCGKCPTCNTTALSLPKITILQSELYRQLKDNALVKKLRKQHRTQFLSGEAETISDGNITAVPEDYRKLRAYYGGMIDLVTAVHYNSSLTKSVFEQFFTPLQSCIIPITHGDIKDCRKRKEFHEPLVFTYLGPPSGVKGFFVLKSACDQLWREGMRFKLNVFFSLPDMPEYMRAHERYNYSQLESIFADTDMLICPSVCNETFGYTVLEALSCGVPVIVSGTVGAKDIIPKGGGIVTDPMDAGSLAESMRSLSPAKLREMNEQILSWDHLPGISTMAESIFEKCYKENF